MRGNMKAERARLGMTAQDVADATGVRFDYQSDRHCSKTSICSWASPRRLITSQIDTAPKRRIRPTSAAPV